MHCLLPEWVPFELYSNSTMISFSLHCRLPTHTGCRITEWPPYTHCAESQSGLPTPTVQNHRVASLHTLCRITEWPPYTHCAESQSGLPTHTVQNHSGLPTPTVQNLKMCMVTRGPCTAGRQYHSGFQSTNCTLGQWLPSTSTAWVAADGTCLLLLPTLVLHASCKQLHQLTVYPETHTPPTVQCPFVESAPANSGP